MKQDVIITTDRDCKIMLNRMMIVKFECFLDQEDLKKRVEELKKEFNTGFVALRPMEKAIIVSESGEVKCIE